MDDPDDRRPMRLLDSRRQADGDLSDSDDEGEGGRRDHASHKEFRNGGEGNHKFGMGVGILASSTGATHGAGPSGHTHIARVRSPSARKSQSPAMDVDSPSSDSVGVPATDLVPANSAGNTASGAPSAGTPGLDATSAGNAVVQEPASVPAAAAPTPVQPVVEAQVAAATAASPESNAMAVDEAPNTASKPDAPVPAP